MARNGHKSAAPDDPVAEGTTQVPADPMANGIDAAREWIAASLAAAQKAADWMERLQALNTQLISSWSETLTMGSREIEQASDPQKLMAVPPHMVNHQLELMSRQLASAMQDLFDVQAKWMEQWRAQVAGRTQRLTTPASTAAPGGSGSQPASLAALGQFQDQWLAMTQGWIDALGAATGQGTKS